MILGQKVVHTTQFSQYFLNYSKIHDLTYVFDLLIHKDNLCRRRGLGKKSVDEVESFLQEYFSPVDETVKVVEGIVENISKLQIKTFPQIVGSKEFKKLDKYFRELHEKGYSNKKVLPDLVDQSIGLLYEPQCRYMNSKVFLAMFKKASEKNKTTLLAYLKETRPLFVEAYQKEILKQLLVPLEETFETLP